VIRSCSLLVLVIGQDRDWDLVKPIVLVDHTRIRNRTRNRIKGLHVYSQSPLSALPERRHSVRTI
jgi:hypothetical protein